MRVNIPIGILSRSFQLIFAQPHRTLFVIAPGAVLYLFAAALLFMSVDQAAGPEASNAIKSYPMLAAAVVVTCLAWMSFAILWHRHALLEGDQRAKVMRPGADVYGQYFKSTLVIFLIMFVLVLGGGIATGIAALVLNAAAGPMIGGFASIGLLIAFFTGLSWVLLRISLILPAAATGHDMGYQDSWDATRPVARDIFWTAVLLAIVNTVLQQLAIGLAGALPAYTLIFDTALAAIQGLVYVSVLSTLYGHLIQGRSLS